MNTTMSSPLATTRPVSDLWSNVAVGVLALLAVLVHSYNMFGYPMYKGDEGIYMAQAFATLRLGSITPYAYWYDHAPAGWILISVWAALTGGFYTFGTAVDSGRVLMLVLHVASLVLLFRVALRLTSNIYVATIAGLFYTLSPMSVIYGRMVLLDNIMIFWVLLSLMLMLRNDGRIWQLLYAGLCFGVAVLSKEVAFALLPAFLFGLWTLANRHHARFARAAWLFAAIGTISLYPLYAALRRELFDFTFSSPLAGGAGNVSLMGALLWQINRGGGAPWDPASDFYRQLTTNWLVLDPWLIGLGVVTTAWNLLRGDHRRRMIGLMSLMLMIYLSRGGVVEDFYIIPLLPFLALNVALAAEDLAGLLKVQVLLPMTMVAVAALGWFSLNQQMYIFTGQPTTAQRQALAWVQTHVPYDAQIVIDDDLWVDLRDGAPGKPRFSGAHSHWKVANDPAVHTTLYNDEWQNLDYLVLTPGMVDIFKREQDRLPYLAYSNSTLVQTFSVGNDTVEIRRVNYAGIDTNETLWQTYRSFRERFIRNGQVRTENGFTNSRDQAGALLMAVTMDDRDTFDRVWGWTSMNLQRDNKLLYDTNQPGERARSNTDADTDAALALLLAEQRWGDASYGRAGREITRAIWRNAVVEIDGVPYLAAGDWAVSSRQVIFSPAAFAPYAYHVFAKADPQNNWWFLLDSTYELLNEVTPTAGDGRGVGLPPDYVAIDRTTGDIRRSPVGSGTFNETAAQVYWRVGLDAQWHDDPRPDRYLGASRTLLADWQARGELAADYTTAGRAQGDEANIALYSAVMPQLMAQQPDAAHALYATKLTTQFTQSADGAQWGDGKNVTEQRWAWLTTAWYNTALNYNLWGLDQ